jgi:hypothetical protein
MLNWVYLMAAIALLMHSNRSAAASTSNAITHVAFWYFLLELMKLVT